MEHESGVPSQARLNGGSDHARVTTEWLQAGGDPNRYDSEGWTPLLIAAARGRADVVELLLFHEIEGAPRADPNLRFEAADALPLYMAGQNGDRRTVEHLLRAAPRHLFEIATVNGHTVLLQASFFGSQRHVELARYLLEDVGQILGLDDEAAIAEARHRMMVATTVRGFHALELAQNWNNEPMVAALRPYDTTTPAERKAYLEALLDRIRVPEPTDERDRHSQALTDRLVELIQKALSDVVSADQAGQGHGLRNATLAQIEEITRAPGFEINRLGGPLGQPPLVVAVTGGDAIPAVTSFRMDIVQALLRAGADPDVPERHPMAVDAIIRAAVFNHFEILKVLGAAMTPEALAAALNTKPAVNGQTALHDTVHRSLTAPPEKLEEHLRQIRWAVEHGARYDIEDHTGKTQVGLARAALDNPVFAANAARALEALGAPVSASA